MDIVEKEIRYYLTANGKAPFRLWFGSLKDKKAGQVVDARVTRLCVGNFGQCAFVGQGVYELKVNYGPGYRVYFGSEGSSIVVLLCGGDKSSQRKDIERAQYFWRDYERRRRP